MTTGENPEIGATADANGIKTNYLQAGNGDPVVLIHGSGPGVTAYANWRLVLPALAENFRVLAPDMVGFGFSERPTNIEYGVQTWADQVVGLMDTLELPAAHLVGNHPALVLKHFLARVFLVFDDLLDHLREPVDDVGLRFAEGHLVGNLEEVAERLGAFAVEAADGEADLVHGFDDLGDLVVEHEGGQVHHGGGAHAGADVGGAGGEVADLGREGEIEFFLQLGVEFIDGLEERLELQAGAERLDPQMVLLVDHDAERTVLADDEAAAGVLGRMFAADEVLLDEDLLFGGNGHVCARWTLRGVHTGEYGGVAPTHREIAVDTCEVYTFTEGKVTECYVYGESMSLFNQLAESAHD